jgi:hypothetical protein
VKSLSRSLRSIKDQHESKFSNEPLIPGVSAKDLFDNFEEVILELGQEMVSQRSFSSKSSFFSTTSTATGRSGNTHPYHTVQTHRQPHHQPRNTQHFGTPENFRVSQPALWALQQSLTHRRVAKSSSSTQGQRNATDDESTPNFQPSISNRSATSVSDMPEEGSSDFAAQTPAKIQRAEGDYVGVQPSLTMHTLDEGSDAQIHVGFINANRETTSALVYEDFTANVISELQAKMLGLHIEWYYRNGDGPVDKEHALNGPEEVPIEFGNGDVQPVLGRVAFTWRTVDWKSFRVTCFVCEYVPVRTPLIFGQPYIKKKNHYANERIHDRQERP